MLVLSRKLLESAILTYPDGGEVEVKVLQISHGRVRLGFEAPAGVRVLRSELLAEGDGHAQGDKAGGRRESREDDTDPDPDQQVW